jgi:hypothetical protein
MQRWAHILHEGTTARVAFNGWHTFTFPVQSGVFQGSPLSPLLFVLAARSMAAHARRTAAALQPRHLSSGDVQPGMHQHADDTTIHAATTADAKVLLSSSVDLHCRATGTKLQRGKTIGLSLGSASHLAGLDVTTGVIFAAPLHTCIRHLGIPLKRDAEAAVTQLYRHPAEAQSPHCQMVWLTALVSGPQLSRSLSLCSAIHKGHSDRCTKTPPNLSCQYLCAQAVICRHTYITGKKNAGAFSRTCSNL